MEDWIIIIEKNHIHNLVPYSINAIRIQQIKETLPVQQKKKLMLGLAVNM